MRRKSSLATRRPIAYIETAIELAPETAEAGEAKAALERLRGP